MDFMLTIGRLLYDAFHLTAFLLTVFLELSIYQLKEMGPAAWIPSALWLALLLLDLTGRVNLHGEITKLLAATLLPAVMGTGEILLCRSRFWNVENKDCPLEVYSCILLLLLLLVYLLIREEAHLERAEEILRRGCELSIATAAWLLLLGGCTVFMATVGILLSVLLGELMAGQYNLLDYGGVGGVLAALLALHLVQSRMLWRGLRLARQEEPDLVDRYSFLLWLPAANLFWASWLKSRLWKRRMERENPAWNQL